MRKSVDRKTILVTGGAGFVGSHACKALFRSGYLPITFDSLERGHKWAVKWGPLELGDLNNAADLKRVFINWKPWGVLHFAAYAYVGESTADPVKYYVNNIGGTANLLAACRAFQCKNIIFSSSCATYGIPARVPIEEDDPQEPINPYGFSKLISERMLAESKIAYGMNYVVLRYFNAAGADPDGELGEWHQPETHLIPLVLLTAAGKQASVSVYGDDYPTPDGTCVRDYVHVSDLADAHVAALEWLSKGNESTSFNLGNGHGFSVAEVIQTCREVTGRDITIEVLPRRPGDPPTLICNPTRALRILNWRPRYSLLNQQILHAWNWFRSDKACINLEETDQ